MNRLSPSASLLLIVDVQEKLAAAMPADAYGRLLKNALMLVEAARLLEIPVVASEQYPRGLGPTVAPLRASLAHLRIDPIEKLSFDAMSEPRIAAEVRRVAPRSVVVVGMEAHVCVFQTARELARLGYDAHVPADAVTSRTEENRTVGLALCQHAGAVVSVAEAIVFDWVERAGTDSFRAISKLVR